MPSPVFAFYDCSAGLLPCKVTATASDMGVPCVLLTVTAERPGYMRGEQLIAPQTRVYPRTNVRKSRRGPFHINVQPYDWAALLGD